MDFLLPAHSGFRWLVILVAVIAIVRYVLVWAGAMQYGSLDATLMRIYNIVLGIQVLLGLVLIVYLGLNGGGFPLFRILHGVVMIVATALPGMSRRFKAEGRLQARNYLFIVLASLVLVFIGVALLPGGWTR